MPVLFGNYEHKTVGATVAGELFRMPLRNSTALCIMLDPTRQGGPTVGILSFAEVDRPAFFHSGRDTACISYGTNWLLDPELGEESAPMQRAGEAALGTLYLQGNQAVLRFDLPQNPNDYEYITSDLLGAGNVELERNAVAVRHWSIWATAEDRADPRGRPIVEFGAP